MPRSSLLAGMTGRPGAVGRPCGQLSAQLGTGTRDPVTRRCATFLKALGKTTDPTKPGLIVRELGRHSFE